MSNIDLRFKHRPKQFDGLIGQNGNLSIVQRAILTRRKAMRIVFSGPYGCGKSTAKDITATGFHCNNPNPLTGDPCYICEGCRMRNFIFSSHLYLEFDGTTFNTEQYDYMREMLVYDTCGKFRVCVVEELHRLNITLQEKLLNLVENPMFDTTVFIIVVANDNTYKVCEPLIQRFTHIKMLVPSTQEIINWLRTICQQEGLPVKDEEALSMIADYSQNIPRRCLGNLEKFAILEEPVSVDSVRKILDTRG